MHTHINTHTHTKYGHFIYYKPFAVSLGTRSWRHEQARNGSFCVFGIDHTLFQESHSWRKGPDPATIINSEWVRQRISSFYSLPIQLILSGRRSRFDQIKEEKNRGQIGNDQCSVRISNENECNQDSTLWAIKRIYYQTHYGRYQYKRREWLRLMGERELLDPVCCILSGQSKIDSPV